jgi:hypothetical protein
VKYSLDLLKVTILFFIISCLRIGSSTFLPYLYEFTLLWQNVPFAFHLQCTILQFYCFITESGELRGEFCHSGFMCRITLCVC